MALQSMTAIANITLQAAAPEVVFSGIPNTYRDLVLVFEGTSAEARNCFLYFNNDKTKTNYSNVWMLGNGSSALSGVDSDGSFSGSVFGANRTMITFHVLDYAQTNKHKTRVIRNDAATNFTLAMASRWANTAAVATVNLEINGLFSAGSIFSLYGRIA